MENVIIVVILLVVLGAAAWYVCKTRKSGKKCIGCPGGCSCKSGENACCGCGHADETESPNP